MVLFNCNCLFVCSELHTFTTTYTEIYGQTIAGIPEFSAVTTLDGEQIDYYDSEIKKLIPRQDWMKEFASTDMWKEDTEIRERVLQTNKINIHVLMERFNQSRGELQYYILQFYMSKNYLIQKNSRSYDSHFFSSGVHTYQRMYGCGWDDQTGASEGFDQHSYDGEDFISLDVKELR